MLNIGSEYSFDCYASSILGQTHRRMQLSSIMSWSQAIKFADVEARHLEVYPFLPVGAVEDYKNLVYYLFETQNNQQIIFASNWIKEDTINVNITKTAVITIPDVSLSSESIIREALIINGIINFRIEFK